MTFTINERNRTAAAKRLLKTTAQQYIITNGGYLNSNLIVNGAAAVWFFDAVEGINTAEYFEDAAIVTDTGIREQYISKKYIDNLIEECGNKIFDTVNYKKIKIYIEAAKKAGHKTNDFLPICINNTIYNALLIRDALTVCGNNFGMITEYQAAKKYKSLYLEGGTAGAYIMPVRPKEEYYTLCEELNNLYDEYLMEV